MEKPKISVSFSGGRTSGYMSWLIKKHWSETHDLRFVFANTGKENEETLEFVHKCDLEFGLGLVWVEAAPIDGSGNGTYFSVTSFENASRNGEPFEAVIQKYGIPNASFPHCTRELKAIPMLKYLQSIGWKHAFQAIGIRMDEFDRMSDQRKEKRWIYPLIQNWPSTKQHVSEFWAKMPFDLQLKDYQGNCDFCWKKAMPKLVKIAKESPEKVKWWAEMERKYSEFKPENQVKRTIPSYFNRQHTSIGEITSIAEKSKFIPMQLSMFSGGDSCDGESCEAFL